ncbi:MAG TPA: 50S ribosomal protein L1 [Candidatus Nanoarchaeia archaeon]|nr:50S ribosomal protein L1 [Candidatus Nanoarchaeia archaeon]
MQKDAIIQAIKQVKETSPKRKFKQSFDLIINLKDLDLKKNEQQVDFFGTLPAPTGKRKKICALVDAGLKAEASKVCDGVISDDEFDRYAKDKKAAKKLATEYDFFIAQANLMAKVAAAFGRALGPKGKMPNPKAGAVVPLKAQLQPVYEKLQNTTRISAKVTPIIQLMIGTEDSKDDDIANNVTSIYNQIVQKLPQEENNIKSVFLKLTMGKPVRLK